MALDKPKDSDHVYDIEGFQYIIDKDFMERVKPVKIDFLNAGFKIDCSIDFGKGCSSCGTASSSCC